MSSNIKCVV